MTSERLNQWIRGLVLCGLLAAFVGALIHTLFKDEAAKGFGRVAEGTAADPGIRVLIANRQPPDPIATYDKILVEALQPLDVIAPDAPVDRHETLKSGSLLRIDVAGQDGFLLSSPEWGAEKRWGVQSFFIVPKGAAPVRTDNDGNPVFVAPRTYEAADHQAVFRLVSAADKPTKLWSYRGSLEIRWNSPKDMRLINHLPLEAYLEGVVAVEMSPSWPIEALKAQAVASRGFAFSRSRMAVAAKVAWDLKDTREDQEYHGAGFSTTAVVRSVFETRGVIPTIHGAPFIPLFSAASGGHSSGIEEVFPGARDLAGREPLSTVMMARPDPYCLPAIQALGLSKSHGSLPVDLKPKDVQRRLGEALAASGRQIGYINAIRVGARDLRSNRVLTVLVHHTLDTQPLVVPAATFRTLVGPQLIKSTLWSGDPRRIDAGGGNVVWRLTTSGWGHGVGMSQVSAWEMARQGFTARAILGFFYQDVELTTLW